jgi:hypothetical protein
VRCAPLMMQLSPHAELNCLGCDRQLRNRTMCTEFSAQPLGALARSGFLGGARQALEGAPAQLSAAKKVAGDQLNLALFDRYAKDGVVSGSGQRDRRGHGGAAGARRARGGAGRAGQVPSYNTGRAGTGSSGPVTTSRNACGRLGSTSNDAGV